MKWMMTLFVGLLSLRLAAQEEDVLRAALYLTGASAVEELDEEIVDRLEACRGRPVSVNAPARGLSAGLLSAYQVASLEDYRRRSGDIFSWRELELVDGFGPEVVLALRPFLSLSSQTLPGQVDTLRLSQAAVLRGGNRGYGGKYRIGSEHMEAACAWKGKAGTACVQHRARHGRWLAGDFNARFGQGLVQWSGFSLSGLPTLQAFSRRASGVTPSWSFTGTGTHRGVAWDGHRGRFDATAFVSVPGLKAWMETGRKDLSVQGGLHVGWTGRQGQGGATTVADRNGQKLSLEGRYGWKGVDLFGEAAWKIAGPAAILAGSRVPLGEGGRMAVQLRALPSRYTGKKYGEYAVALGGEYQAGRFITLAGRSGFGSAVRRMIATLTVDAALLPLPGLEPHRTQIKTVALWNWQVSPAWASVLRVTDRYRSYERRRTEGRWDLTWSDGRWSGRSRLHAVQCRDWGLLGYVEGGFQGDAWILWLRSTVFRADAWSSRIYCYERDVPGCFTVPAYYGRGIALSAYSSWKKRFRKARLRIDGRVSYMFRKEKPGQTGLQLQATWSH